MLITLKRTHVVVALGVAALFATLTNHASAQAREWYVSPAGSASNSGTISSPLSLAAALSGSSPAQPGDTVWVRGGTYAGAFTSNLTGTATSPIKVRAYPDERAVLDGNNSAARSAGVVLTIGGGYTWYMGLEVMSSDAGRTNSGSNYGNTPSGIYVNTSQSIKLINLIVHDMPGQGMGLWTEAINTEVYGCLVYYNGLSDHDHGIYLQNQTGTKRLADNFIFSQASHGIHAYSSTDSYTHNIVIEGNTVFEAASTLADNSRNILLGGMVTSANPVVDRNYTYFRGTQNGNSNIGYTAGTTNARVTNNYFVAGNVAIRMNVNAGANVSGNVFVGGLDPTNLASTFPSNTYLASRPTTGQAVFVRPNQYEPGRAHVTIYNWSKAASVTVALTGIGLTAGDEYEIRDAQDFFGAPVATGVYSGAAVTVPMNGGMTADPVGNVLLRPQHTAPEFGTFVVLSRSSGNSDTTLPTVSVTAPSPSQTVAGTVTVSATASDDAGVAHVQFLLDGQALGSADAAAPYSVAWNSTAAGNGSHTITAVATDTAGNQATSAPVTILVNNGDATAPTVQMTTPSAGQTLTGSVTLSATASDNVGVVAVQFMVDGVNAGAEDTTAPYSMSLDTLTTSDGSHIVTARARDAAGNASTSAAVSVTISNSASQPAPPGTWTSSLEAESGPVRKPMTRKSSGTASNGRYVATTRAEAGEASFQFNVPAAGTYVLWGRVLAPDSNTDSFYVLVDGKESDIYDVAENSWTSAWQWTPVSGRAAGGPRKFVLSAGWHTFTFRGRELNTGLDSVLITNDQQYRPQ